ncbi:hypothetical protein PVAND_008009 [Polypedilum vanderplanki]|uniref:Acetyl-CoA carboxylase n=1 Tax=Polypedilum vanderplanki TaxID=319348 RepID=A0A9J6C840_POLVA|nr:hypothetical protein PVAND_008009 [Polypedilum vanderplanki]
MTTKGKIDANLINDPLASKESSYPLTKNEKLRPRMSMSRHFLGKDIPRDFQMATTEEFVKRFNGTFVIDKILVANNGYAAVKFIRSIRRWCKDTFKNEKAIKIIVLATPEDLAMNAEFIELADHCASISGGTENFSNIELILDAAKRAKANAVWPGWNAGEKNLKLAETLQKKDIAFLGPSYQSLSLASDTINTFIIAQTIDIPTIQWNGSSLKLYSYSTGKKVKITDDLYDQAAITNIDQANQIAKNIGFPVVIKSAKGGEKSYRIIEHNSDFSAKFHQLLNEYQSPVIIMKHIPEARYVEIPLIGDKEGNVISVFTRDCTIKRQNLNIIEEAPAIFTMPKYFDDMERAAIQIAKVLRFEGVGSALFLYNPAESKFFFYDFSPYLQMEHACTEMLASMNLCACQVQVAMGISLNRIKDIRMMLNESAWDNTPIDFEKTVKKQRSFGHVITARITADELIESFRPLKGGSIKELNFRSTRDVWGYYHSNNYQHVSSTPYGHCFAWGDTRNEARQNLIMALKELSNINEIATCIEYLSTLLDSSEFVHNAFYASYYDRIIAEKTKVTGKPETLMGVIAASIHIADRHINKLFSEYQAQLERGQITCPDSLTNFCEVEMISDNLKYNVVAVKTGENLYTLIMNDCYKEVSIHRLPDGGVFMTFDSTSHTTHLKEEFGRYYVTVGNKNCVFYKDFNPSILRSPSPGKLICWLVNDGDELVKDQPYAEIEVLKSILTLYCQENGIIRIIKNPGEYLERDTIIGHLELDYTTSIPEVEKYTGGWLLGESYLKQEGHIRMLSKYKTILGNSLAGFCFPEPYNESYSRKAVKNFINHLKSPKLPLEELNEIMKKYSSRLPQTVEQRIRGLMKSYESNLDSIVANFPAGKIAFVIDDYASSIQKVRDRDAFFITVQEILQLIQRYRSGIRNHMKNVVNMLLKQYYEVECHFQYAHYDKCVSQIRENYKEDMQTVMNLIFSHSQVGKKNFLMMLLLDEALKDSEGLTDDVANTLNDLTTLTCEEHSRVALKARKFLITAHTPSYEIRRNQLESILLSAVDTRGSNGVNTESVQHLIESQTAIFDVLHEFFFSPSITLCNIAMEIYIRRIRLPHELSSVQHCEHRLNHNRSFIPAVYYTFRLPKTHLETVDKQKVIPLRIGCITAINGIEYFYELIDVILSYFESNIPMTSNEPIYIIYIAVKGLSDLPDDQMSYLLQSLCLQQRDDLLTRKVRRITFLILKDKSFPKLFNYRARDNYEEDRITRSMEPAGFYQLEINRLKLYEIQRLQTENCRMNLYLGTASVGEDRKLNDFRYFIRAIVRHSDLITNSTSFESLLNEGERVLLEAIEELEIAMALPQAKKTDSNHIFMAFLPCVIMDPIVTQTEINKMISTYATRLWKLRVLQIEMKFILLTHKNEKKNYRLFVTSELGYFMDVSMYGEILDTRDNILKFKSINAELPGPFDNLPIATPYKTRDYIQRKRFLAQSKGTTYCYDFPDMFRQMSEKLWHEFITARLNEQIHRPNQVLIECNELILIGEKLAEVKRPPGENEMSIVAWKLKLATPEFPDGRELILIANDLTASYGAISIHEALFFEKVSQLARLRKIPRILISASTGVRVGLDDELKSMFKISWRDRKDLDKGCKYIYLLSEDYSAISDQDILRTVLIEDEGESRYRITDVIGLKEGLGIENLHFASMIESETVQAYNEIVTISMVTSQTIGIGAQIVKHGKRVVQIEDSALVLANYTSLNRNLGFEAYTSNQQIGGCEIMSKNGTTHKVEADDLDGIYTILHWLSYMSDKSGGNLPIVIPSDQINRKIDFTPTKSLFDPRMMLSGRFWRDRWESGFFDRYSWSEIKQYYAPSAITGRARLGGIPVGVIAAEMRTSEVKIPADPGQLNSQEKIVSQIGNYLYPDSAQKIAHAIKDFNREDLPLIIFANWHGISSGQSSMMNGLLNYTTLIVEALREYKQPVFIYLPPHAEMRGGTWNLFSSFINPHFIEMYADVETKAGVDNPESDVEKKFRLKDIKKLIHRLDPQILSMKDEMSIMDINDERAKKLDEKIKERTQELINPYISAAVLFADIHDTSSRLVEKGCIGEIVPWRTSRPWFYWRLNRMLLTNFFIKKILECDPTLTHLKATLMIRHWFIENKAGQNLYQWDDNQLVANWLQEQKDQEKNSTISKYLEKIQKEALTLKIQSSFERSPDTVLDAVVGLCSNIPAQNRREVIHLLTQMALEKFEAKFGHE